MRRSPGTRVACLTLAAFALVAGSASAATFCVNDSACVSSGGTSEPTIQAAFTAAAAATPPSTVSIGPGQYGGSPSYANAKQITVTGSGEGQTIIMVNAPGSGLGVSGNSSDLVSSLSVQVDGTSSGLQSAGVTLGGGSADHVSVAMSGIGAAGFTLGPGKVTNSSVSSAPGTTMSLAVDVEAGPAIIQDTTLSAADGVGAGDTTIMQRDRITATDTGVYCFAQCSVEDSLITMAAGSSFGLRGQCSGANSDVSASNVTIVGPAADSVDALCGSSGEHASVSIDSSIIRGAVVHALLATALVSGSTATITPTYDDYDPSTDAVTGTGSESIASPGAGQINADPMFIDSAAGDYRIPWNSRAVDAGDPSPLGILDSTTDLGGNPRVVNGRRDIGAFEYQRQPPTAAINQDVQTATTGHAIHFDASQSTDPDPGDTLTFAWRADDGATGTGTTFAHAFAKAGTHSVTLTVADPTGLTATATATVTVTATAAAPPSITRLRQSHRRWSVGPGTTFSFRLNSAATVRLVFSRHGHRVAALSRRCHAGQNRIHFSGRLKHGKRIRAGRYTVSVTAANSAGASKPRSLKFRVL